MCLRKSSFLASSSKPEALRCRQNDLRDIQRATMGMDAIYEAEGLQVPDPTFSFSAKQKCAIHLLGALPDRLAVTGPALSSLVLQLSMLRLN